MNFFLLHTGAALGIAAMALGAGPASDCVRELGAALLGLAQAVVAALLAH